MLSVCLTPPLHLNTVCLEIVNSNIWVISSHLKSWKIVAKFLSPRLLHALLEVIHELGYTTLWIVSSEDSMIVLVSLEV